MGKNAFVTHVKLLLSITYAPQVNSRRRSFRHRNDVACEISYQYDHRHRKIIVTNRALSSLIRVPFPSDSKMNGTIKDDIIPSNLTQS